MTFPPAWESGSQACLSRCVGLVFEPAMMLAWWKDSTFFQSHLSSLQSVGITTGPTDFFSQDPTLGHRPTHVLRRGTIFRTTPCRIRKRVILMVES